ncbi:carboxymuconolactone decarboxylase family protein [Marinomonas sp. M1K-6]|uniref:Carboxymuconolactone decarboxylase family protein n=1 Tax=Marinomonas profundi TaxID=2726122 RepID=A0A847R5A3_9GAMM|nr:carboxymuconolactone decarboxylase family protein [Marinomonas profundi]NLQ16177.1 carboxymuconolactone decarboxylase family protein [Marinomonas profundi]UDV03240.1 carboxymuconolactone decarboxylase family protein [Marinomonas profundi]
MLKRINYYATAPQAFELLFKQEQVLGKQFEEIPTLSKAILELVKLRVSQINQCAFCLDMHSTQALEMGETHERMIALSAWQDSPLFSEQERQALALSEHLVAGHSVDDAHYEAMLASFGESGLTYLTIAINAISSWNRIVKVFKPEVGSFR